MANWDARGCIWWLQYGHGTEGILHPPKQCTDVFDAVARNAVVGLPSRKTYIAPDSGPRAADVAEPWQLWLDFMRFRAWGFQETSSPTPCTEREWDLGVKDGKPLVAVRREQKYTTGDEWKEVFRRASSGDLERLSEEELKGKNSKDLEGYYHWLPNGTIAQVFQTSARFCEELASHALISEVKVASSPSEEEIERDGNASKKSPAPDSPRDMSQSATRCAQNRGSDAGGRITASPAGWSFSTPVRCQLPVRCQPHHFWHHDETNQARTSALIWFRLCSPESRHHHLFS
jgi:hypothetical protein